MTHPIPRPSLRQVSTLINRLPLQARIRLAEQLGATTWEARFERLIRRLRAQARVRSVSDTDIRSICEDVRQRRHAQGRR